ncbi:subtilase-type protease inhibitor [Streptomyces sp. NBC_01136]|uniref:subtilase-type protease inhibitor n=1 Tax=unclassified Streptomyces TaxID=2593676 RepID=UPI00324DD055|nr:subtilase-type protease inhibitor [Streptomyces sp. NBC_01136]
MPTTARWAATLTLTAAAVCAPLGGSALAAPAPATPAHAIQASATSGLYAPSALVLTVGHGENAATVTPERAVTLNCAPTASGTHPAAFDACAELRAVNGDFDALSLRDGAVCTRQFNPVVVTVEGVWRGKRVAYERTFANECVKNSYGTTVFTF